MSCAVSLETFTIDIDDAVLIRGGGGVIHTFEFTDHENKLFQIKEN